MDSIERKRIAELIKREVIPAIGCTEPIAVSLCVAKAAAILGTTPQKIDVLLSANVLKNAMGVGIPGTDMIGLPIAVALGAVAGRSEYGLEVLKEITAQDVERGKAMIADKVITIGLKNDAPEMLYIEVNCRAGEDSSSTVISGMHTRFVHLSRNGKPIDERVVSADGCQNTKSVVTEGDPELDMRKVYDFITESPLKDLEFILSAGCMNHAAAEQSLKSNYGHGLGRLLKDDRNLMGSSTYSDIISYTCAACDARMAGAMIPVMSNSGSGNQGISANVPVMVYARRHQSSHEDLVRALMLSNLTVIYIKQGLGRLSALCGCVVASTGSSCGITYLMGDKSYEQICYAVKNMIANLTGMICDGAKPSCSLKVSSGTSTAVLSAIMALSNRCVTSVEGIIDEDVDKCIQNLTDIGAKGMTQTDRLVLEIMTRKS